ncbi:replication protein O [Bacillus phage vB_BceS-M2]
MGQYIKLSTNMFNETCMKMLETMPDSDKLQLIWIKLACLAGSIDTKGYLLVNKKVPFTTDLLGHSFGYPSTVVKYALRTYQELGMIEVCENDVIKLANFEDYEFEDAAAKIKEQTRLRVANHRKTAQKKLYAPESDEVRLAHYLLQKIRENNPDHKEPNLQTWAGDIEKMIRIDGRTPQQVQNMIDWCQADHFWKANILSGKKLREKYDQMKVKALAERGNTATLPQQVNRGQAVIQAWMEENENDETGVHNNNAGNTSLLPNFQD